MDKKTSLEIGLKYGATEMYPEITIKGINSATYEECLRTGRPIIEIAKDKINKAFKERDKFQQAVENAVFGISEGDLIALYKNGSLDVGELLRENKEKTALLNSYSIELQETIEKYEYIVDKYNRLIKNLNILIDSYECIRNEVKNEE